MRSEMNEAMSEAMTKLMVPALLAALIGAGAQAQETPLPPAVSEAFGAYREALERGDPSAILERAEAVYGEAAKGGVPGDAVAILALNAGQAALNVGEAGDAEAFFEAAAAHSAEAGGEHAPFAWRQAAVAAAINGASGRTVRHARRGLEALDALGAGTAPYGGRAAVAGELNYMIAARTQGRAPAERTRAYAEAGLAGYREAPEAVDSVAVGLGKLAGMTAVMEGDFADAWSHFAVAATRARRLDAAADDRAEIAAWADYASQFLHEAALEAERDALAEAGLIEAGDDCPADIDEDCVSPARRAGCPARDFLAPQPVDRPQPSYPARAERVLAGGFLLARVDIDAEGAVEDMTVIAEAPVGLFAQTVRRAVKNWRYAPATCRGEPIASPGHAVFFNFQMRGSEEDPGRGWRLDEG